MSIAPSTGSTRKLYLPRWITCLLITIALITIGCTPSTPKPSSPSALSPQAVQQQRANELLNAALSAYSPARESLLIEAAQTLYLAGSSRRAMEILGSLDHNSMPAEQYAHYVTTYSEIALEEDAYFLAQNILTAPRLEQQWPQLTTAQKIVLLYRRADVLMLLGHTLDSIGQRITLDQLLGHDENAARKNRENLWRSILTLTQSDLQQLASSSEQPLAGWAELALISKDNQASLENQMKRVEQWQLSSEFHPAAIELPSDLQLLRELIANQPKQIALLLPQSGQLEKAGNAIRDGFMAALFQSRTNGGPSPTLKFYNSEAGSITAIYSAAVNDGADMVIGPLDKDKVIALNAQLEQMPVPTLAVNYIEDSPLAPPSSIYQIGLAVEDESRQVAQRAWLEGHRHAIILSNDSSWGTRSSETFAEQWKLLGGELIAQSQFSNRQSYDDTIGNLLDIDDSKSRYKQIRDRLGMNMEFEPRRRQDIDAVYIVARTEEARQIRPTLSFHYASDLPVYASSHIFQGKDAKEPDLNGIRFTTLPWLLSDEAPEKQTLEQNTSSSAAYEKLHALGVDIFYLHARLPQLELSQSTRYYGVTGSIYMTANRQLHREQLWAVIESGVASQLPALECLDPELARCAR